MSLAVQFINTQPNTTISFDFGKHNVLNYVVGIAYWKFTFGSKDHHVQTCALNLTSNRAESNKVTVKVGATLSDSSGNNISNADSTVTVCIVAVLDEPNSQLALAMANSINDNSASAPIALPGSNLSIASAALAGWQLSYGNSDHHVKQFQTAAGLSVSGTQGQITAQATMTDSSGHTASTASINGGLIAATTTEAGLLVRSFNNLQTTGKTTAEFDTDIRDAVVLLQSVEMQFKGDHHVRTLGGGVSGWSRGARSVTLNDARAFMLDTSGNNEVKESSGVNLMVVALRG